MLYLSNTPLMCQKLNVFFNTDESFKWNCSDWPLKDF